MNLFLILLLITVCLVASGYWVYVDGQVGLAQLMWVLASGCAGGAVVALLDRYGGGG